MTRRFHIASKAYAARDFLIGVILIYDDMYTPRRR